MKKFFPILLILVLLSPFFNRLVNAEEPKILKFEPNDTLEEIRRKIEHNKYNFTVGHNWVYDMPADMKKEFFSRRPPANKNGIPVNDDIGPLSAYLGKVALPTSFDWRDRSGRSYIGPVRDQGYCGSCYAFGAAAAAEGTYNYATGKYNSSCADFSESFIAWCLGDLAAYNDHFYGCDGADYDYYELKALCDYGIINESLFPYQQYAPASCTHMNDPKTKFKSWHRIPCGDINAIKTAIMVYGVVDAAVLVEGAFEAYESGVYTDSNTTCEGCYYESSNHAIALVGWDDGDQCWILRNSWNSSWGEDGYMRIQYNSAGVDCAATYLVYEGSSSDSLTVTSPNGGEQWTGGSTHNITWSKTSADLFPPLTVTSVKIEYSSNNGSSWTTIVSTTDNDGSYSWTVPNISSTQCLVRIKDAADSTPSDTSNAVFTIKKSSSTDTLTLTSPNGGEKWSAGSTHNITWTKTAAAGDIPLTVTNVKIQYSTNQGDSWTTVTSSTDNDGSYSWKVPSASSSRCLVRISDAADGTPADVSNAVFTISGGSSSIAVNRTALYFNAVANAIYTGSQTFTITCSGSPSWTISDDASWLSTSPTSGSTTREVTVTIDPTGLANGSYTGTITITASGASGSPKTVTVYLTVKNAGQDQIPFGEFSTPVASTGSSTPYSGSIPFTGWVLDDIGIESVDIYYIEGYDSTYIGSAVFIEGARPDVQTTYPTYPLSYKAGWGYMLLSYFLPGGGNGSYTLEAVAVDQNGVEYSLGTTTITIDNAGSVKPFGAIDFPAQGGTASGSSYVNAGWVLTPMPSQLSKSGSTINVYIDSINQGHVTYNQPRPDIASLFPGYYNTNGAGAVFTLDTTNFSNGQHIIFWVATDNNSHSEGIGSRYFTISNTSSDISDSATHPQAQILDPAELAIPPLLSPNPVQIMMNGEPQQLYPDDKGILNIDIKELDPIEIHFFNNPNESGQVETLSYLPIGSTLDMEKGIFYWRPAPGFIGSYTLDFIENTGRQLVQRKVLVTIHPKHYNKQ